MTIPIPRPVRFVILHTPGPNWKYGVDFRQQEGVGEHIQHYAKLHEQEKLQLDGPFLVADMGGMMITTRGIAREEIEAFAAADPAVKSGVLNYQIRPWMTVMEFN